MALTNLNKAAKNEMPTLHGCNKPSEVKALTMKHAKQVAKEQEEA
jgi:hypothetical protein